MMTTNLHHVCTMFNSYLLDDLSIHEDNVVKSRFLNAMRRLTTSIDGQYSWLLANFQSFKECKGAFANMPLAMEANIPLHK